MTKDEARTILAMMASDRHEAEADALLMAIDALSVDGDLISRQDAIEAVGEWMQKEFGFLDLNRAERLIDALSALPSAEAVQGWIPCSERLPSNNDCVLVTVDDSIEFGKYQDGEWSIWVCEHWDKWDAKGTIAWMPLPKPYREESEVEE